MGQTASANGQQQKQGGGGEDPFRHFRDEKGGVVANNGNQMPNNKYGNNNYDNNNYGNNCANNNYDNNSSNNNHNNHGSNSNQGNHMSLPSFPSMSGVTGSCLYTDVTRPNGPMNRPAPMDRDREFGNPGNYNNTPNSNHNNHNNHDNHNHHNHNDGHNNNFSTHNMNRDEPRPHSPPRNSAPPAPHKAEASTMMSTAFLQRNYPAKEDWSKEDGGVMHFKIDTVHESEDFSVQACAGEAHHRNHNDRNHNDSHHKHHNENHRHSSQSSCTSMTYDEEPHHDDFGMVTCDEPIMAYEKPPKKHAPMQQAPPRVVSQDSQFSGFSAAITSVSRQHYEAPSTVGSSVAPKMNVADELKTREAWAVGSIIEVFSTSAAKWYIAQLAQVGEKATSHMITVQFVGDNGQIMQKSMPRSDVQLAVFGRNTRQMPPGFQKVASESRPGQFSYQDSASGQKYQNKELAWQNYYHGILKCEQAQQLLRQQSLTPQGAVQTPVQAQPQAAAVERLAAERLKPQSLQPAPTMSLAPAPKPAPLTSSLSSDVYAGAHGPDPVLAPKSYQPATTHYASSTSFATSQASARTVYEDVSARGRSGSSHIAATTVGEVHSLPMASAQSQQKPQTMSDLSSLPQPLQKATPFPGYGQSFAVGTNAGYEAYLASQGLS